MTKPLLLKMDEALVARIDGVRGDVPRTVWIVRACERALTVDRLVDSAVDATDELMLTGRAVRKVTPGSIDLESSKTEAEVLAGTRLKGHWKPK